MVSKYKAFAIGHHLHSLRLKLYKMYPFFHFLLPGVHCTLVIKHIRLVYWALLWIRIRPDQHHFARYVSGFVSNLTKFKEKLDFFSENQNILSKILKIMTRKTLIIRF
jgi:hypothetical protein